MSSDFTFRVSKEEISESIRLVISAMMRKQLDSCIRKHALIMARSTEATAQLNELTYLQQLQQIDSISPTIKEESTSDFDDWYEIINNDGMIDGPFIVSKVANIFVSQFRKHSLAESTLWIRPCQPDSSWYKLNVNYLKNDANIDHELCADHTFYKCCGNLFKIIDKLKQIGFYCAADEYPKELEGEPVFHIVTMMINYGLFIFSLLHIHILIYFFCLIQSNASLQQNPCIIAVLCIVLMAMAFITSCCVAYSFIYFSAYDEIQSWMVAYIAWITIQWIEEGVIRIMFVFGYYKTVFGYDSFRLNLLGIQFRRKNDIIEASGWHNCWISAVFALLPSSIIGFTANYVFDEQFGLECDSDLLTGDLCFADHRGCCVVVSSHDISRYESMYEFLQVLASNIIAVYGLIRIIAWFMISQTKQYRGMAQKTQ
eukprot:260185_1